MKLHRPNTAGMIGLILLAGLLFRLTNVGFGLPAMYDPDEPFFVLKAFKLLSDQTLNPHWFGHPGSTTIYLLALVDIVVAATGFVTGRFTSLPQLAAAVYADPAIIFLPSRLAMVAIGLATIWLTFLVGRRLFGRSTGLLAAALLSLNAIHIAWSQVIRTDIHSSLFMLAALLFAIRGGESGRTREFALAGLMAGFAIATKWPAATVFVGLIGAAACLFISGRGAGRALGAAASATATTIGGLFIASPFVFLDWRTVLENVSGEVASGHLGHSGGGFLPNLWWYLADQVGGSMGWIGLGLALVGLALFARHPVARVTILPVSLIFLVLISAQAQIWSRWLTPLLPLLCISTALAVITAVARLRPMAGPTWRPSVMPIAAAMILIPSVIAAVGAARERGNDTRDRAAAWAGRHIPPGSTVVVEHLALDLRSQPWRILFPIGEAGCVDGRAALTGGVRYESVQKARKGSAIVDLANVPSDRLASCRGDFLILTYYDLYLAEGNAYPRALMSYRKLIGTGRTVALFRPEPYASGGPVTRVVALQ